MKIIRPNDIKYGTLSNKQLDSYRTSSKDTIKRFMQVQDEDIQYIKLEKEFGYLLRCDMHPFVQSLHYAYCDHLPLNLSPDIIWYIIASAVSIHMKYYASEKTRKKYLNNEDLTIHVRRDDFKPKSLNPWYELIDEFCHRIEENTKSQFSDYVIANFSTTSRDVKIVSQILLVDSMQKYFKYEPFTLCGIPEIRINGTRNDWEKLRIKANNLLDVIPEFKIWMKTLNEIFQKFIDAFDDKVDYKFWNEIYKCMGDSNGPFITGWVLGLFPYLSDREKNIYVWKQSWKYSVNKKDINHDEQHCYDDGLTTKDFIYNVNQCPFIWNHMDKDIKMQLIGGIMSVLYEKDNSITPVFGHAVIQNKCNPIS